MAFLRKAKQCSDFQRHKLRVWIDKEPAIEDSFSIFMCAHSLAIPLINHLGIRLAISMTPTNIMKKCEATTEPRREGVGIPPHRTEQGCSRAPAGCPPRQPHRGE